MMAQGAGVKDHGTADGDIFKKNLGIEKVLLSLQSQNEMRV